MKCSCSNNVAQLQKVAETLLDLEIEGKSALELGVSLIFLRRAARMALGRPADPALVTKKKGKKR